MSKKIDSTVLKQIDDALDQAVPIDALSQIPLDIAIIHLLRFYENYNRLELPLMLGLQTDGAREGAKLGQDAFHFAMEWVYKFSGPATAPRKTIRTDPVIFVTMRELCESAGEYSQAWDYMNMMHRDWMDAEFTPSKQIVLRYRDKRLEEGDVADLLLSIPDAPDWLESATVLANTMSPAELIKEAKVRRLNGGQVEYKFPHQCFRKLRKNIAIAMEPLWQLPGHWDVGGYTIAEFKSFWLSLLARCKIHSLLCFKSDHDLLGLESLVLLRKRSAWANEMARLSGVDYAKVQLILDDLIYDRTLYVPGKKHPDVTFQPFFCIGEDMIAPSNWLVVLSNAEHCLWGLSDIKRPEIHSVLRNEKEKAWMQDLNRKAQDVGLSVKGPIKFSAHGIEGDIDLVLIDEQNKFILLCQMKWIQGPDRIKDIYYACKELDVGVQQAKKSITWISGNKADFARKVGLSEVEFAKFEVRSCVLSRAFMGKGRVCEPDVPVISERVMGWVLGSPLHKTLRDLWIVANERRYQPKAGVHYVDADCEANFGGYKFIFKNGGMQTKNSWDPAQDIDVAGL